MLRRASENLWISYIQPRSPTFLRHSPITMRKTSRPQPSSRTCLLVGAVLIVLAATSFLRPDLYSWHWNNPIQFESHHSQDRFALHPENHVFRQPSTRYLDWYITSGFRRPDGVLKEIYLINGTVSLPTRHKNVQLSDPWILTAGFRSISWSDCRGSSW